MGIIQLGLTPTFLDEADNIVTAHRGECNSAAELSLDTAMLRLIQRGVASLPDYLPEKTRVRWKELQEEST